MTTPAWIRSDLTPIKAPLQSTLADRDAWKLKAIVDQFCVETALRYQKRDITNDGKDETFCNFFARDVSEAMHAPLPQGYRCNDLAVWLPSKLGKAAGFEQVTEHVAQAMANEGQFAVAIWRNPTGGSGHIAVLLPCEGHEGTWIAQAGARNFSRGLLSRGFGSVSPILFFGHP